MVCWGKDNFKVGFKFIKFVNKNHSNDGIDKVFVVADRDEADIPDYLGNMKKALKEHGDIEVGELKNNEINKYSFVDGEKSNRTIEIIPIVVPFEEKGAIETVLMNGILEKGEEEKIIVDRGKKYIDDLKNTVKEKYLKHDRLVLKAKLSAVVSVINPDRSTGMFKDVLMSWDWEESNEFQKHSKLIVDNI